jgi:hypothetical protein
MNGWIKKFADGTQEIGSDYDIRNKKASWRRGRLGDLVSVELHHNGTVIILDGIGEYWQSDDLEAHVLVNHDPNVVTRRIQKKIMDLDFWMKHISADNKHLYQFRTVPHGNGFAHKRRIFDKVGKWFTVELDVATNNVRFYFSEDKI